MKHPDGLVRLRTFGRLDLTGCGTHGDALIRQPKRVALLSWLAISTRDGWRSRDSALAVFWPELDQRRARAALRNALYFVSKSLPERPIMTAGDDMLRIDRGLLWCDAVAFEEALEAGQPAEALSLYRGDFLDGLHVAGVSEFDAWRTVRVTTYRRRAVEAALALAGPEADPEQAEGWLRRASALAPLDDEPVRRLLELLRNRGDAGAVSTAYRDFVERLSEAGLEVAEPTRSLGEAMQSTGVTADFPAAKGRRAALVPRLESTATEQPVRRSGRVRFGRRARWAIYPATAITAFALMVSGARLSSADAGVGALGDLATLRGHVADHDFVAAFEQARHMAPIHAGNPEFEALRVAATFPATIRTDRDPVRVLIKDFARPSDAWVSLGVTPLDSVRIPATLLRWRLVDGEGRATDRAALDAYMRDTVRFKLPDGPARPNMLQVTGDALNPGSPQRMVLSPFWLDRFEVTNREYARFVASRDHRALAIEGARFTDRTGMPGPSTWASGTFPAGAEAQPVSGVSWPEATAYCSWAGKELPTAFHWYAAGGFHGFSGILSQSNFSGRGLTPRGQTTGIGPYGHRDLAGNVRERVSNPAGPDGTLRYTLGGSWDAPHYLFWQPEALDPMDRSARNGFRCAQALEGPGHPSRAALKPSVQNGARRPIDDAEFTQILRHYAYDPLPVQATVDDAGIDGRGLRWEDVSFAAAYGEERVSARIFLPAQGQPPYSTVVFHPGAEARHLPSFDELHTWWFAYLVHSGRAVVVPAVKGTLNRRETPTGPVAAREQVVQRIQDLRRTLDYLETREDLDSEGITYMGFSEGGVLAPLAAAVDPRIRAAVVLAAGVPGTALDPVVDPVHFLPRARTPLLLIGGADDFIFPADEAQRPFFELWGGAEDQKSRVVLPFGHTPERMAEIVDTVLPWIDHLSGGKSR